MRLSPLVSEDFASRRDYATPLDAEPSDDVAPSNDATEPVEAENLYDRIRRARGPLTKAELARRIGVCLSAAVQWEHPRGTSPTVSHLADIARVTEVSFEWLATGRGTMLHVNVAADAAALSPFEEHVLQIVRGLPLQRHALVIELLLGVAKQKS